MHIGATKVLAHATCEVATPFPDRPTEGMVRYNVELSPMASPAFEPGRPSEYGVLLTRMLERTLKEARALDLESLCIVAEEKVWSVRVNVHVLDHCGNLTDTVALAALGALLHVRRPFVSVSGQETVIHSLEEREPVPLAIHHRPVCVTMALVGDSGDLYVVDPTRKEEMVSNGSLTVAINSHREICGIQKLGGAPLTVEQIGHFTHLANEHAALLLQELQAGLKADEAQRAQGVWSRDDLAKKTIMYNAEDEQEVEMASEIDELAPIDGPPVL